MSFCEFWFMYFVISLFWPPHLSSHFWSSFARFSHESRWANNITRSFIFYINTITRFILYLPLNMASRCGWCVCCVCLALAKMANHVSSNSFSLRQRTFSMHYRAVDVIFNCLIRLCGVFYHLSQCLSHPTLFRTLKCDELRDDVHRRETQSFKLKSFCDLDNFRKSEKKNCEHVSFVANSQHFFLFWFRRSFEHTTTIMWMELTKYIEIPNSIELFITQCGRVCVCVRNKTIKCSEVNILYATICHTAFETQHFSNWKLHVNLKFKINFRNGFSEDGT